MLNTKNILVLFIGSLLLLAGCDDSYITNQDEDDSIQVQNIQANSQKRGATADDVYKVTFKALNAEAGYRTVKGIANLRVRNDKLTVQVNANGLQPGMLHPQHIHAAGSCPSTSADANNDGFIDVVEGVPSYGGIFVPLDADLADLSFQTSFPNPSNKAGAITYKESVSVSELESAAGEDLNLEGRHLVIHGVSAETDLPETVQSLGGLPANLTLPIACGEVVKVK